MARILYTVCGIGLGHATRSSAIIEELAKRHEVFVASYGDAYEFLRHRFNMLGQLSWFRLIFKDQQFCKAHTFFYNLPLLPYVAAANFIKAYNMLKQFKPDMIVSDFDVNGIYIGQLFGIPVATISNMHLMNYHMIPLTTNERLNYYLTEKPVLDCFNATDHLLISSFIKPHKRAGKTSFFHPIVRPNLLNAKPKRGDHTLVYTNPQQLAKLVPMLRKLPARFVAYGAKRDCKKGNVELRRFTSAAFESDLLSANAVLCHGGISMLSEAVALKKPAYVFTSKDFFERYYNGALVAELGLGEVHEKASRASLAAFLPKIPEYAANLERRNIQADNSAVVAKIEGLVAAGAQSKT